MSATTTTVAVTGATGFQAGWIIEELLKDINVLVRGTVRSLSNTKRLEFLHALPGAKERLRLFEADLTKRGSFDPCFTDSDAVIHVAAVTELAFKEDAMKEIVADGVEGAREVAAAAQRCGVKRVVVTSSGSLVDQFELDRLPSRRGKLITEDEHRADLRPTRCPYVLEKVLSEQVVRDTFTNGPQSSEVRSSQILMKMLAAREAPLAPRFYACYVDVRDCATAHRLALSVQLPENVMFRRYIISGCDVIGAEHIAESMNRQFKELSAPTWVTPHWLMWLASFWDERLTDYVRLDLAEPRAGMDSGRAVKELGWKGTRKLDEIVRDCVDSFKRLGLLPKKE